MRSLVSGLLLAGLGSWPHVADAHGPEAESAEEASADAAEAPTAEAEAEQARRRAEAKQAAKAGSVAFRAGDYATALEHFSQASELLASPKLHYNIAVCHHRLMLVASDEASRNAHNDGAIEAYNRYLEAKPEAEDRHEVSQTVRDLGGTPATYRGLKSAFEGIDDVVEEGDELTLPEDDTTRPPEDPAPAPARPQPTERYHARFQFAPHVGIVPQQIGNDQVAGAGALSAEGKAGGYLGRRRRILLGTEFALFVNNGSGELLAFSSAHIGAAVDYEFHLGRNHRTFISLGGMGGFSRQAIRTTETAAAPLCSQGAEDGKLVAARHGGVVGARFNLGLLFGERRWHEVGFALHPLLGIYGPGTKGMDCGGAPSEYPFRNLEVATPQISVWAGLGYAFRF